MSLAPRIVTAALLVTSAACRNGDHPIFASQTRIAVPVEGSAQLGPDDAWVTLVVFADLQCPFYRARAPLVLGLAAEYETDLRIVFKHFPLSQLHPDALDASVAAECAGAQQRFWEMSELLVRTELDPGTLLADAKAVDLDLPAWQSCLASPSPRERIQSDILAGESAGVSGTPTFFANGLELAPSALEETHATVRAAIEQTLASAIESGIPRAEYYDRVVLGL